MELVYLLVEEYKNIKKQGFNFSPRFYCEYNDDTKELTINENRDYIDIFPENINITAIVGKNGSGKSNIFECFLESIDTLYRFFLDDYVKVSSEENFFHLFNTLFFNKDICLLFFDKNQNSFTYILKSQKINLLNKTNIDDILKIDFKYSYKKKFENYKDDLIKIYREQIINNIFILHYDYSFTKFRVYKKNIKVNSYFTYSFFETSSLVGAYENFIKHVPNKDLPIKTICDLELFIIINIITKGDLIDKDYQYFSPTKILIKMKKSNIKYKNLEKIKIKTPLDYIKKAIYIYIISLIEDSKKENYKELFSNITNIKTMKELENFMEKKREKFEKFFDFKIDDRGNKKGSKNLEKIKNIEKAYKYIDDLYKYNINHLFNIDIENNALDVKINCINQGNIEIINKMPPKIFAIHILDKNLKEYNDLSNGEKSALRIRFYIEDIISKTPKKNFFILLDEPANDMHPRWQKELLKYLIDTFKNREQNIHFIITTHSPFLISDLPKENIIFLDRDKNGNCKVVDGLKDKKQTFGANIHTLLSDSFFMEDGLMGEFAKSKIDKIREFYQKVIEEKKTNENIEFYNKNRDRFWQIQSIIGEPFLKTVLKNQLEEIEAILFDKDMAKEIAIKRFIREFGEDEIKRIIENAKN